MLVAHSKIDALSLSQTIWAVAKLGHAPSPDWLASFFLVAQQSLPVSSPQGLANLLWGMAVLQVSPVLCVLFRLASPVTARSAHKVHTQSRLTCWTVVPYQTQCVIGMHAELCQQDMQCSADER